MSIDIKESLFFDNAKLRKVTVFDALTVAAGATGAWSGDVMPYLAGSEGYVTAQFVITGSGEFSLIAQGTVNGTDYGNIRYQDGDDYGTTSNPIASGLTSSDSGDVWPLEIPLLGGLQFAVVNTSSAHSVTVTMSIICKAQ